MAAVTEDPGIAALSCGNPVYLVVLLRRSGRDGQSIVDPAFNWAPTISKADFVAVDAPFAGPSGLLMPLGRASPKRTLNR